MSKPIKGRCPECCPDGGAYFDRFGDSEKECRNCGSILPYRRVKPSGKPTKAQQRVIDRLVAKFGGEAEVEMHGRRVWVSVKNADRNFYDGRLIYGSIGPRGAFKINVPRIFGDDVVIHDAIGMDVYLKAYHSNPSPQNA